MTKYRSYSTSVFCDASFCPETRVAAWAVWLRSYSDRQQFSGVFRSKPRNCCEAELWAVQNAIYLAFKQGAVYVLVQTDSLHAVRQIEKQHLDRVRIRHVKGHSKSTSVRSFINRWCDKEARRLMRKARMECRRPKDPPMYFTSSKKIESSTVRTR